MHIDQRIPNGFIRESILQIPDPTPLKITLRLRLAIFTNLKRVIL